MLSTLQLPYYALLTCQFPTTFTLTMYIGSPIVTSLTYNIIASSGPSPAPLLMDLLPMSPGGEMRL